MSVVLPFTPLTEPAGFVTTNLPPAPFDANIAYLLGQCCSLTYAQFDAGTVGVPDFAGFVYAGCTVSASNLQGFTVSEADEPGPTTGDVGDYDLVTAGFGVQLTLTPSGGGTSREIAVIALRGSRTWDEWLGDNVDAFPAVFPSPSGTDDGFGSVHSGFFGLYTIGTDGAISTTPLSPTAGQRATGSIAAQVAAYVSKLSGSLPLYVTGHSLGGALASICALDVAANFSGAYAELAMYSLASPRVAAGITTSYVPIPYYDNQQGLVASYQAYVPNSYRIVHAADVVPILPPASFSFSALTLSCAHVTDPFSTTPDTPASATAAISGGAVTSVSVGSGGSGYYSPPEVTLTGGGGSGATARAIVSSEDFGLKYYVSAIEVTNGGSGYTSAPSVTLSTSGSLEQNVVSFCAQSGDLGTNHSCTLTYVPYLALLAAGFS